MVKSNFSDNFTVPRFLVNRVVGKRILAPSPQPPPPKIAHGFLSKSENRDYWFIAFGRPRSFSLVFFATKCPHAGKRKVNFTCSPKTLPWAIILGKTGGEGRENYIYKSVRYNDILKVCALDLVKKCFFSYATYTKGCSLR